MGTIHSKKSRFALNDGKRRNDHGGLRNSLQDARLAGNMEIVFRQKDYLQVNHAFESIAK